MSLTLTPDEQVESRSRIEQLKKDILQNCQPKTNQLNSGYTSEEVLCALHELQLDIIHSLVFEQKNRVLNEG
jgi:hypothetical protein